jgi:phage-related protein
MLLPSKEERPARPPLKPLKWVGGSRRTLSRCPEDVKDVFGAALLDVQFGDTPAGSKPFGEGLPREIWKIVEDSGGNTYRAAYTAALGEVVYVLDVFMKKSKSGIGTPRMIKDRVRERFNAAKRDYDEHHRTTEERSWRPERSG